MVSEPNFVLGIKQKSLASKEESHVHITVRSHTYLSAGSKLHSISQPPWLIAVSRSSNRASRDLTYQICAQQAFAWWNQLDRPTSRHIVTKTQEPDHQRQLHAPPRADNGSWNSHTRRRRFSTPSLDLSHTRRQDGLVVHRSTWPENLVVIRPCTCHHAPPGFLAAPPRAGEHCSLLPCADTAADVIWHHMMMSSLHVSSHAITSTSALVHVSDTS